LKLFFKKEFPKNLRDAITLAVDDMQLAGQLIKPCTNEEWFYLILGHLMLNQQKGQKKKECLLRGNDDIDLDNSIEINKLSASFSDIHISNEKDNKENKSNRLNRNNSSNPSTSSFATDSAVGSFQSSISKQAPSNLEKKNYKKIQFNFSVVFK
jgi:hypothetical protein